MAQSSISVRSCSKQEPPQTTGSPQERTRMAHQQQKTQSLALRVPFKKGVMSLFLPLSFRQLFFLPGPPPFKRSFSP